MFRAIWYHLKIFKNVKNTHEGVLLLAKAYNNKSSTSPWMFFTFPRATHHIYKNRIARNSYS